MGSKRNPGKFDCYEAAHPEEPMFVLLGRDRQAPSLVRQWADWREGKGEDPEKVAEARECADEMEVWLGLLGKAPVSPRERVDAALSAWLDMQSHDRANDLYNAGLAFLGRPNVPADEEESS